MFTPGRFIFADPSKDTPPIVLALASFVFAATHHEDDEAITLATIHWAVWIGGVLGLILAIVLLIGLF